MNEEWRWVPGWEGIYEVSNQGRVRSWVHPGQNPRLPVSEPRLLKPRPHEFGYSTYQLRRNGVFTNVYAHRMVLAAFVGESDQQVRHLDGNPVNNNLSNLAYGTQSDNMQDSLRHGTHANASKTHCAQGHPYDEANTYRRKCGGRGCRACNNNRGQRIDRAKPVERSEWQATR